MNLTDEVRELLVMRATVKMDEVSGPYLKASKIVRVTHNGIVYEVKFRQEKNRNPIALGDWRWVLDRITEA